jgi:hypothetical protein
MSILSLQKQSQNTDFPNVRPSLDLRFALAKKLDPRITFTRGSTGTYFGPDGLMRTADVNEPRFDHDPISGQSLGLLIEESRINQLVRGDIEGTVGAQPTGMQLFGPSNGQTAVVSTDVFLGPNGQSCKHTRGTWSDSNIGYFGSGTVTAGSTYVFSAYVYIPSSQAKNFEGKTVRFSMESPNTGSTLASADVTIVDRWQRVWGTCVPSTTSATWVLRTTANTGSFFYTDCWQLELGSLPTSYMPASGGSQFTRSADTASMTGTNFSSWYNQSEGTISVDCASPTLSIIPVAISDGTVSNRFQLEVGTNARGVRVVFNGILQTSYISYTYNTKQKMIMSYSSSSVNFVNAGVVATLIRPQGIPNVNILRIGANVANAGQNNLPISRLTYYPIQLTNQQLINLTN